MGYKRLCYGRLLWKQQYVSDSLSLQRLLILGLMFRAFWELFIFAQSCSLKIVKFHWAERQNRKVQTPLKLCQLPNMVSPSSCVGGKSKARKTEPVFPEIFQPPAHKCFPKFCALGTTPTETIEREQKSARPLVYLSRLNSAKDLAEESQKSSRYFAFAP